ncbi:MAG: hypothetical protein HZR80_10610 [Candidatus Heimdallarchaeota archaeon]
MKLNKSILLVALMILAPVLSVNAVMVIEDNMTANVYDSDVLVEAGTNLYYNLDQFEYPVWLLEDIGIEDNITIPNLANKIQLYIKVLAVDEYQRLYYNDSYSSVQGSIVYAAMGMKVIQDIPLSFNFDVFSSDITIPTGVVTNAAGVAGLPHFNTSFEGPYEDWFPTYEYGPIVFVLNNDWDDHEVQLEAMGWTVTETEDEFTARVENGSGLMEGTWRKSDGVLTHIILDDLYMTDLMNATDYTIEMTLVEETFTPLEAEIGDIIQLNNEIASFDVSGSGELYQNITDTFGDNITYIQDQFANIAGKPLQKYQIIDTVGTFYKCKMWMYDWDQDKLVLMPNHVVFNGYLGLSPTWTLSQTPMIYGTTADFIPGFGPVVTPDWDHYEGYMALMNLAADIYSDEVLDVLIPMIPTENFTIIGFGGLFQMQKKSSYYYFQENLTGQAELNITAIIPSPTPYTMVANQLYDLGVDVSFTQNAYIAFAKKGILAGAKMTVNLTATLYDELDSGFLPEGTVNVYVAMKFGNPDYNPPDLLEPSGFIPGFTWLMVFPAIMSIAVATIYFRKRK